jgi:hypothetical protein
MKIKLMFQFLLLHCCIFNYSFTQEDSISLERLFSGIRYNFEHNQKDITKDWTLVIFIAGDNNLNPYIVQNIEQIMRVGSNKHINIVIRVDTKLSNQEKITKFLYVEKEKLVQIHPNLVMDSGDPDDLISFFNVVYDRYPAHNWGLILWDHGIGFIDDAELLGVDNYEEWNLLNRGICFDDSTLHYLTNKKLVYALDTICRIVGKKLALLGCDACFMNMWEFFSLVRYYIGVAIGSQELESATGWDYYKALKEFNQRSLSAHEFARNIVHAFGDLYEGNRSDYTQAAVNLENFDNLNNAVENLANALYDGMTSHNRATVKNILKKCREKELSTIFGEPSYLDLKYFCLQIKDQIKKQTNLRSFQDIDNAADRVVEAINTVIIENRTAQEIKAYGISIYFPENSINFSYYENSCPAQDAWIRFLESYHLFS